MQSRVTEVAPDVYRISYFHPQFGIQMNQYLVKDDEPFLMHTLMRKMFPVTRDAVASIIDPTTLRWIGFSHFESDECGALNDWLALAPRAEAACSFVGANVMVNDFADRPARALADGEVLDTGHHGLQFVSTPHVPHCWDAGLFFETRDRTLLCSDSSSTRATWSSSSTGTSSAARRRRYARTSPDPSPTTCPTRRTPTRRSAAWRR